MSWRLWWADPVAQDVLVVPMASAKEMALALAMGTTKTSCATCPRNNVITPARRCKW
ncbi:hypothetical protein H257_14782 [Aphanomyces astaci]|uniref:Uncharacterized protein n=1 Tax=Aphanomyces astaci TaxID=112090 RepID=W4FRH6_APHAT|nr:hypothetical protein H257_14782 [Aphanomyces astaci]ETV69546.1 hypothetical protein H257_14782 [Aphanomyces astaci]|eukprot:XP_009840970.1 hypothetical protein H257_14782 [Aphanomyces astaci]